MSDHALLSPSSASRWLKCTPSARFETEFPNSESQAAAEGTLAHKLSELTMQHKLDLITKSKYQVELKSIQKHPLFDSSMLRYCADFATHILEKYYPVANKGGKIFLEKRVDLTAWVPEAFGTVDIQIIGDDMLEIIDLKYGKGVLVSAQDNAQMKIYALGVLKEWDAIYSIKRVRMTIYQPRLDNIVTTEMTVEDLYQWAESTLKPTALLAFEGGGEYVAGSHCRFCRAQGICRAAATENLKMAKHDFAKPNRLDPEDVSDILDRADPFLKWIKAVTDHAQAEALKGVKWPGYKLVEGRSNRIYKDEILVESKLRGLGFKEDAYIKKKLLGIGDMEASLSSAVFEKHILPLLIKPQGAPTLVPITDGRAELNSAASAAKDFKGHTDDEVDEWG